MDVRNLDTFRNQYGGFDSSIFDGRVIGGMLGLGGGGGYGSYSGRYANGEAIPGGGGAASGQPLSIQDLINQQRAYNQEARDKTEANWLEGKGMLAGIMPAYDRDAMTVGARAQAARLLADPEAINDQTQSLIRNQLMNQLGAQAEAQRRKQTAVLASRGQMNPAALARMNSQLGATEAAALSRAMASTEIQRALQRNQDITNATQLGRTMANDRNAANMGVTNMFLENMPEYRPEDLSGMAALLFRNQNRSGGFTGGGGSSERRTKLPAPDMFNMSTWGYGASSPSPGQIGVQTPYYWNQQNGTNWQVGNQSGWNDLSYGAPFSYSPSTSTSSAPTFREGPTDLTGIKFRQPQPDVFNTVTVRRS